MLPALLFNVISSLVIDKASNLAAEHVENMIDDILPDSAKKELDKVIKDDPAHIFTNAKDALTGAVEGKVLSLLEGIEKDIEGELAVYSKSLLTLLLLSLIANDIDS